MMAKRILNLDSLDKLSSLVDVDRHAQESQIIHLSVEQIEVRPQVRTVFENIEELAENFKVEGQQTPIIVGPMDPDTKKYPLQKGERRLRAARLIPGFKLKATVDATVRDEADDVFSQLIENVHRNDLNPYEIGMGLARAKAKRKERGSPISNQEIAKRMGMSETWVSIHLGLADLPTELVSLVTTKVTTDTEVLREMKQLKQLQPETYQDFIDKAATDGSLSRQQVRDAVRSAKGKPVGQGGQQKTPPTQDQAGVSHAKPAGKDGQINGNGHQQPQTPQSQPTNGAHAAPAPAAAKKANGKGYTPITADRQVIGIRVALDDTIVNGYLANDRVHDDPSKAWTVLLVGGSQRQKLVKVDQIEIVSVAAMAETN